MTSTSFSSWSGAAAAALQPVHRDREPWFLPYDAWLHLRGSLRLSDREAQIVQGIFEDEEQESIAKALGISPDLVYRTIQRIYIKLHIGSRAELVVRVMSEYLAFVADQEQTEFCGLSYWPVRVENGSKT